MGVPTVSFVSEDFRGLSNATAKGKRFPDLPIVVLPSLYGQLPEEEIRRDIRQRVPEVLAALTTDGKPKGARASQKLARP